MPNGYCSPPFLYTGQPKGNKTTLATIQHNVNTFLAIKNSVNICRGDRLSSNDMQQRLSDNA